MKKNIHWSWIALIAVAVLAPPQAWAEAAKKPIKFGWAGGLSGDAAKIGQDILTGAQLAVEQVNAKGGILGRPIEMVVMDDKNDPKEGVSVAHKLVTDPEIVAVLGHIYSGISLVAQSIYREANMVMITAVSSNPKVTEQGSNNVFRTISRDEEQIEIATEFIAKKWKSPKIVIVHDRQTFGQGAAEMARDSFTKAGGRVLAFEGITVGEKDFSALLTKINSLSPDILYWSGMSTEGGLLVKQMKALKLRAQFFANDGVWGTDFLDVAGPTAEGVLLTIGPSVEEMPGGKRFAETYEKRFGDKPTGMSPYAYDAANLIMEAIKRAGKVDRETVRAQMAKIKDYQGVIGLVTFNTKGDRVQRDHRISTVKNGRFQAYQE